MINEGGFSFGGGLQEGARRHGQLEAAAVNHIIRLIHTGKFIVEENLPERSGGIPQFLALEPVLARRAAGHINGDAVAPERGDHAFFPLGPNHQGGQADKRSRCFLAGLADQLLFQRRMQDRTFFGRDDFI